MAAARFAAQADLAGRAEVGRAAGDDDALDDTVAVAGAGLALAGVDEEALLHPALFAAAVAVVVDRGAAGVDAGTLDTFTGILGVAEIRRYMARNLLYEIPLLRAALFAQAARKILPALRMTDLRYARGVGGLRPQLIDRAQHRLVLGAAAIDSDEGLLFNITPSPGATMCLANAIRDASKIAGFLGCVFNGEKVNETL